MLEAFKTKCFTQSTFVVIGTDRDRKTGVLRALLAHKDRAGLSYAGAEFIALAVWNALGSSQSLSVWQHHGQRLSPHGSWMLSGAIRRSWWR